MTHTYNPHDIDYLDARQRQFDEHALGLTDQAGNTPLELAAGSRREMLMDELDRRKNRRAPELPEAVAAHLAGNAARRRIVIPPSGPGAHDAVLGGDRGMVTDQSTPMDPSTADTLVRLLRQAGRPQAAKAVIDQVQRGGRPW
jgi:hypothetical protein